MSKYSINGKIFLRELFRDNDYDGYVFFFTKKTYWKEGKRHEQMNKIHYCLTSEVDDYLDKLDINPRLDYYYTVNSFKNTKGTTEPRNVKNNLFGINALVIDIDGHYKDRIIPEDFHSVVNLIRNESIINNVPLYDTIVHTGRGIQVYYIFKSTYKSLQFLFDMVADVLKQFYSEFLKREMPQFTVDMAASGRHSGLFRLPYTINQKAGKEATALEWQKAEKPDINDFLDVLMKSPVYKKYHNDKVKLFLGTRKLLRGDKEPNVKRCNKVLGEILKYQIDKINANTPHENRTRTCYVYASFLLHLYSPEDSLVILKAFNSHYHKPLPDSKLEYIISYHMESHYKEEKQKYLYLTNKTILEMLEIESGQYNIIVTDDFNYRNYLLNEEAVNRRKEKAEKRKKTRTLLKKGYKYKDISSKTGLSISTISRIAKAECSNKDDKTSSKPWEALGISRATYYRRKK
jgi:hypothetical protein